MKIKSFLYIIFILVANEVWAEGRGDVCYEYPDGQRVYLFGTIHASEDSLDFNKLHVKKDIESASAVLMEGYSRIDVENPISLSPVGLKRQSFAEILNEDLIAKANQLVRSSLGLSKNFDIGKLNDYTLGLMGLIQSASFNREKLFKNKIFVLEEEKQVIAVAKAAHIPLIDMEPPNDFLNAVYDIEHNRELVNNAVSWSLTCAENSVCTSQLFNTIFHTYKYSARNEAIETYENMYTYTNENGPFVLLMSATAGRNLMFFHKIKESLSEKKTLFVSVGADHLGGEAGLMSLFRKDGARQYNFCPDNNDLTK